MALSNFPKTRYEFPRLLYGLAGKIYVDAEYAKEESGDVKYPLDKAILNESDIIPFHRVMCGDVSPKEKTLIFKSVGMALFDLTLAIAIADKANTNKNIN